MDWVYEVIDRVVGWYNAMPMWLWWTGKAYVAVCLVGTIIGVPWQLLRNRGEKRDADTDDRCGAA